MQKTSQKDAITFVVILKWDGRTQFYRQMIPVFTAFDAIFSPGFFISSFLYANAASPSLCCRGLLSLLNRIFPVITIIGESDFLKAIAQ